MKFKCVKCKAKYFHNHCIIKPPTHCRFCGGGMVKDKMTVKEFKQFYMKDMK